MIYHDISVSFMPPEAGLDLFEGDIVYDEVRDDILLIPAISAVCDRIEQRPVSVTEIGEKFYNW